MKEFYLARMDNVLSPSEETRARLASIIKKIANKSKPKKYSPGAGNILVEHSAEFEKQCALIEKYYSIRAKDLSMMEFLSRLNSIKEEIKMQSNSQGLKMEQR